MNSFETAVEAIIEKAQETANIVEGDYIGEDNLYYCGKCHTRKQTVFSMFGNTKVVCCICKCRAAEIKAEDDARKHFELVRKLRQRGFPESKMLDCTFANDDVANPKMTQVMKNYVKNFDTFKKEGKGLLLFGKVGRGKSYLAACVVNELINKGVPCIMTDVRRITNELQGMFEGKQRYLDNLNTVPLLVLDDLGAERNTEFAQEVVGSVIEARCRSGLPLIATTNLTREELLNPININQERVYSRLFKMCTPIEVEGKDRRQEALKNDIDKMKNLLGLE